MDKKCNKFLKALAKNLVEGEDHLRNKSLKKVFTKAVKRLPESVLKEKILENFTEAFLNLKIRIKKIKDKVEKTLDAVNLETFEKEDNGVEEEEENVEVERLSIHNTSHDFPFNFYLKNDTAKLECLEKLDTSAANQYFLKKIQLCSNQENVVKLVKEFQRVTEETTIISTLDHLLVLTSGMKDPSLIKKLLFVFLRKIQPLVEKYLEEENLNKAATVQESLHQFLCISQMRYNSSKTSMKDNKPLYKDLIASLVSMYLDLSFFLFRNEVNKIKLSRLLYGFVNLMLKEFPEQKYDVLLQLTQTHPDQIELLYPLLQFCVERRTGITDAPSYIKFVLSVAMANNNGQQTQLTFQDAIKRARSVIPPEDVGTWLEDHELSEVTDEIEDINSLTLFLLDNMTDDLQTKLIDGLCDDESVEIEEEEEVEEDVVVFNSLLNDSGFFTSATAEAETEQFEDIFMVDKKGSQTCYVKETAPSQADEPKEEDIRKSAKKNKVDKSTSSLIKSSHKMVAVVSPNRKIKHVELEEVFSKSVSNEKISDDKSAMHMEQHSPKLRSTAKYLRASPNQTIKMETESGSPEKSPEKLRCPDRKTKQPASMESSFPLQLQKQKTTLSEVNTAEDEALTTNSTKSPKVKSPKVTSPQPSTLQTPALSSGVKTPKSTKITSSILSTKKAKISTSSDVQTPKVKSPTSSDADDKPTKRKLKTALDVQTPKTKNTTIFDTTTTKVKSPTPSSDIEQLKITSPVSSDLKRKMKTPKLKSPEQSAVKTPKSQSIQKSPKLESAIPSDVKTPKITSPTRSEVKTPKLISPTDVKAQSLSDGKTPKIKTPTPSVKSPTSSDSDLKKGKVKSPKPPSPKSTPSTSDMIESKLTKSPKLKSPQKQSSNNQDDNEVTFKSPKPSLPLGSNASSTKKSVDSSDLEIISLSSESSIEVSEKSVRKGTRTRRPSNKFLLSQASALSTGEDTESERSVFCLTPKPAKLAPKANTAEGMIKEYLIISDSENTDSEQTTLSKRKRSSNVPIPDLAVHLNKSRKSSSSAEADLKLTPSKLKQQKRKSTGVSEGNSVASPQKEEGEYSVAASDKSPKTTQLTGREMHSVLEKVCNKLEVVKEDEVMTVTTTKTKLTSDITKVRSPINLRRRSTSESAIADAQHAIKRQSGTISDGEISSKIKAQPTPSKTSKTKQATDEKDEDLDNKKSQSDGDVGTKSMSAQKTPLKRYALRSR